ncbi:protein translocase subunit SecDF [Bacillus lacus]|uniref:Multifunctional fusion protein n=1 Tax=Metabacillus lacus TaxID=1983721 RepID=A0A7X2LWE4_9BACI|nr:protein translocase subunit SecDF [Metabacillus lacus]MRX71390.1 protein translocase subunit SecDF [Metabacillus lacus]
MVRRWRIVAFFLIVVLIGSVIGINTKQVTDNIVLGLDLQGGFEILYEVQPANDGDVIDQQAMISTVRALTKRADVLGVNEPNIQIEGENRIRVQLAGVQDQNQAREILSTQAELTFRDVENKEMMNGSDLVEGGAQQSFDSQDNSPIVTVKLRDAEKFRSITEEISQRGPLENSLVIWLDFEEGDTYAEEAGKENPKFISAPAVQQVLNTTDVMISGNFTVQEAQDLANLLNAGALPVSLKEIYSQSVGAKFGEQAMDQTVTAGMIGIAIIFLFMLLFYRLPGIVAFVTLSAYIFIILQIFDWMNGVLTLPGIAALILGVGMAVDANIITYERIKEEIKLGRTVRSAFRAGNRRSFSTILDANITTLLAGAVLFFFGTSSIKGFATMLMVSILVSFLTAVFLTRLLLGMLVESRLLDKRATWFGVNKKDILDIATTDENTEVPTRYDNVDFVGKRKIFFTLSAGMILAGLLSLFLFQLNLGIDFASGTRIDILSEERISVETVREELAALDIEVKDIVVAGNQQEIAVARLVGVLDQNKIAEVRDYFEGQYGADPTISTVSPTVGEELARNALMALGIAAIGIIIYVSIRFEFFMALAAIAALLHDSFFILAFFSLTRLEVDITFIAAVLTIVGYSINDTIVTFDRIRENMKKKRMKTFEDLAEIVNKSLQQTFTRSINTVLTVFIAVVSLAVFGASSITNFSIALIVGLIAGTYSSLFIASQLWLIWKYKQISRPKAKKQPETNENPLV